MSKKFLLKLQVTYKIDIYQKENLQIQNQIT